MTNYDFGPLFRSTVGFDRMMRILDSAASWEPTRQGFPAYDIEKTDEDLYHITLAVPGLREDELRVEVRENTLVVSGGPEKEASESTRFLHRGIAQGRFEQTFELADYVTVVGATLDHGLLRIELRREIPEELKPRKIEISTGAAKSIPGKPRKLVESGRKAA